MIVKSIEETIGNTPLLSMGKSRSGAELFLKLEMFNPTGSMKDRMAKSMMDALETDTGDASKTLDVVESSSGNTASALSMLCAARGWNFKAIMDGHASKDKVRAVRAFKGTVEFVEGGSGELATADRDQRAREIAEKSGETFWTAQHDNPANSAGYSGLCDELIDDLGTDIFAFVSAIGTGGSLCGTAYGLKRHCPFVKIIGVEPTGSIIFGGPAGNYLQSGTGTPQGADVGLVIDFDVIDEGHKVCDQDAFLTCHFLAQDYGLLVGGSGGGAIFQAIKIVDNAPEGSKVVALACDSGSKYLDTVFSSEWLSEHGLDLNGMNKLREVFAQH